MAVLTFALLKMGLTLSVSENEAVAFCEQVASGQVKSADQVITWVADRLQSIEA